MRELSFLSSVECVLVSCPKMTLSFYRRQGIILFTLCLRDLAVKMTFHGIESVLQSSEIVLAVTIYVEG